MPNYQPIFVGTPIITTAVTATVSLRDGGGPITQLFVADPTNGSRVERISAFNTATQGSPSQAMQVRVFIANANGTNPRLFREQLLANVTPAAGTLGAFAIFNFTGGLMLGTNSSIYVGQGTYTGLNDTTHWTAEGGHF